MTQKIAHFNANSLVKSPRVVMPVPDQVRDDGSGIQNILKSLDSGFRRNDGKTEQLTFYEIINVENYKRGFNSSDRVQDEGVLWIESEAYN